MPKTTHFPKFDIAEFLDTPELVAGFISDAFDTGYSAYIAGALGIAARAKGMSKVADAAGLSREQLYRSLSDQGNPKLKTLIATLKALGLQLHAVPTSAPSNRSHAHPSPG